MLDQQVIDELVGNMLFVVLPLTIAALAGMWQEHHQPASKTPRIVVSQPHYTTLN